MSNSIKRICNEVIEAADLLRSGKFSCLEQGIDAQGSLITHADKLARALLVMEEALIVYAFADSTEVLSYNYGAEYAVTVDTGQAAHKALTQAEKILGGEE